MKKRGMLFLITTLLIIMQVSYAYSEDILFIEDENTNGVSLADIKETEINTEVSIPMDEGNNVDDNFLIEDEEMLAVSVDLGNVTEEITEAMEVETENDIEIENSTEVVETESVFTEEQEEEQSVELTASVSSSANTSFSNAISIGTNISYLDNLSSSSDVNYYRFTLSGTGYISLKFDHGYIERGWTYWKAYLYDSSQKEIASYSYTGNVTSETGGNIGLPAGKYYLKICRENYSNVNYNFKINYTDASAWETEFNDSYLTADIVSVNHIVYGSMRNGDDSDWYQFTIANDGYISLSFVHEYIERGWTYWKAYLYDSSQKEITSYSYTGNVTSETGGNIGLPAGKYYLKICRENYSNVNYNFKINYIAASSWETEFNDSYLTADVVSVNHIVYGSMRNRDDSDWYQFTIANDGYISLSFVHEYIERGWTYWKAYLYDSSQKEITSYSYTGNVTSQTGGNIGLPAGKYYLKICRENYSNVNYNFKISYTSSSAWETEFNDSYSLADTISANQIVYGSMQNNNDNDWYKVSIYSRSLYRLTFSHNYINSSWNYWKIYVYDSNMKELISYSVKGNTSLYENIGWLSAGTYYIKVAASNYSDFNYWINFTDHIHNYVSSVTKATTSQNGKIVKKCSCGAIASTTTIYYPKTIALSAISYTYDGKTKTPSVTVKGSNGKVISSSNYTVSYSSGRKNVGLYFAKVTFKGNYSGSVWKTFVISPKGTSISSLSAKSKAFAVKIKKQSTQTTGYQIQYSTSSKFTSATTKTIKKASTTSATYKNLKGNTTYYVRVRTYKTVSGKTYYSAWSSAKSVKTKK